MDKLNVPSVYSVALDPKLPILGIGFPKSIFEKMIHGVAELVRAVVNFGSSEEKEDPETGKGYLFLKRNLKNEENIDIYLAEALKLVEETLCRIATLMSEQGIKDETQEGEYWRALIDLDLQWQDLIEPPKSAAERKYGWVDNSKTLQWNEDKGVIRIKTKTLEELRNVTRDLLENLSGRS